MRGGRGPPSNRPEPTSRPQHLGKTHHPRRRRRRAFLCTSYLPIPTFTDTTPPITPADIPALFLAATSVLRLINAGTSDGRRFSAAPQAKDRAAWRLVQTAVPSLTDKAAQEVINSWLRNKVLETRSYRDPIDRRNYPGLFVTPLEEPAEVS